MTRKERRELARKLAKEEKIIQNTKDEDAIKKAKERVSEIILSNPNLSLQDIDIIDEMVQKIIS